MTLRTCALVLVLLPAAVSAAPLDEAKGHFAAGKTAFERGQYETALAEFLKAYELAPAPSLLYNMGKTYEELGRYREAASAFEKYLVDYGAPQNDEDKQFQENLRARIASDRGRPDRGGPPQQGYQPPQPQQGYQPPQGYPAQPQQGYQYPPQQYPPNYYPPQQYGYQYQAQPTTYRITKNDLMAEAAGRRNRAIALIVVGTVLDVIGIAVLVDGLVDAHTYDGFTGDAYIGGVNYVEDWIGASMIVVGITLWAPGIGSYARATRRMREVSRMPDPALMPQAKSGFLPSTYAQESGRMPQAVMFSTPAIRF